MSADLKRSPRAEISSVEHPGVDIWPVATGGVVDRHDKCAACGEGMCYRVSLAGRPIVYSAELGLPNLATWGGGVGDLSEARVLAMFCGAVGRCVAALQEMELPKVVA